MATGRFAPSPTGPLHLGNLRTGLLAWCFARRDGGRFLLRVEDLQPHPRAAVIAREQEADLVAIGLDWDGPVLRQSDRRPRHDEVLADLEGRGLTYPCYCSRREVREAAAAPHGAPPGAYPGTCRTLSDERRRQLEAEGRRPALRLRGPGEDVAVTDELHGEVRALVDDLVLRRNDGVPAYNLAVVVDDADQGVEQVVRGDDLLSSTPRQAHLADLLGFERPAWAHVPLVLGPDGERLAKRHGAVTLADLARAGFDAAAVRSLLAASLGWAEPGEPVSMADVLERFDPATIPLQPWRWEVATPPGGGAGPG